MSVSRDVILDLVPLYLAGEASPATRALVEAHLAGDLELAGRVRAMAVESAGDGSVAATLGPPPELELTALRRTRSRIAALRWLFAIGVTCTVVLLSCRIDFADGRLVHFNFLFAEAPVLMGLVAAAVAAAWIAYFSLGGRRR